MAGMIVANVHMGFSSFHGNEVLAPNFRRGSFFSSGFSLGLRPSLGIGLKVRNRRLKRGLVCKALLKGGSDGQSVGGSILEKEFEFKPSFDEYLKVMESVKTVRDKKLDYGSEKKKTLGDEDEVDVKMRVSEGNLEKAKELRVVEKDGLLKVRDVFKKQDNKRKNLTEMKGRFDSTVRISVGKTNGKLGRDEADRKWPRQHACVEEEVEEDVDDYRMEMRRENESLETWRKKGTDDSQRGYRSMSEVVERQRIDVGSNEVKRGFKKNSIQYDKVLGKEDFRRKYERVNGRTDGGRGYQSMSEVDERERNDVGSTEMKMGLKKNIILYDKVTGKNDFRPKNERVYRRTEPRVEEKDLNVERAAFRNVDEFNDVMDGRRHPRVEMDERIHKLAMSLNGADVNMPEWIFSKMMRSAKIMYTDHAFSRLIQILGKLGNWRRVLQVIEWLQIRERFKSHKLRYIYTTALCVLGKARRPVEALNVFNAMQQQMSSYPDLVAYHSIAVTLGQAGHMKELFDVIDTMRSPPKKSFKTGALGNWDPRVEPDMIVYNAVLNACAQRKQWEGAFWVLQELKEKSLEPSVATYGLVMEVIPKLVPPRQCDQRQLERISKSIEEDNSGFSNKIRITERHLGIVTPALLAKFLKNGKWRVRELFLGIERAGQEYICFVEVMFTCGKYNLVHDFFRKVQKSSIPNALTYRVLVNTLWKEGKLDEAILAVKEMEKRGIVGSAALYYDFSRCLCSAGRIQEALRQIEKICKVANKPLVVTYTGLIQACIDCGNVKDGAYIFSHMKDFCSPNLVTCNIMLKGFLKHGMFDEGNELFQKMLEDGSHIKNRYDQEVLVAPDIYTFNTLLDACIAEKRWDDFEYAYEKMLHHGFHFNSKRHLPMILSASRAGKGELVDITWTHLVESDRTPPPSLVKERFCMKLEKGDYVSALSCISTRNPAGLPEFSKNAWSKLLKENSTKFQGGTLVRLIHEISNIIARTDQINPLLDNLLASCKELCRTSMVAIAEPTETFTTIPTVPALKL